MNPAIANRLSSASKILYMSHMAIGDYLYQRTYLQMLSEQYPNAEIDLWIDDFRTKGKDWQKGRSDFLSNWMKDETFITRLYPQATSIAHRKDMLEEAKNRGYDAVLFIANLRSERFASANQGIVLVLSIKSRWIGYNPGSLRASMLVIVITNGMGKNQS